VNDELKKYQKKQKTKKRLFNVEINRATRPPSEQTPSGTFGFLSIRMADKIQENTDLFSNV
jgi:hypothetical protein